MRSIKQNRGVGFFAIVVVYMLATVCGIAIYRYLPYAWWLKLLLADVAATVVTFFFSLLFGNASVYDPYWSIQPIVILAALAAKYPPNPSGCILLGVISFWGIRLTVNWAYTFGGLTYQDWRYTMLREQTGVWYPLINLMGIHMVPTLIVYGCVMPAAYALVHQLTLSAISVAFCSVSLAATVLQGAADWQMHRFRCSKTGGFIRTGLWKYSRHPNYLGEILMWWGIVLAVIVVLPSAWYLMTGAAANTALFLAVSIPMADRRQSRKPGFDVYRAQTRRLLPIRRFGK